MKKKKKENKFDIPAGSKIYLATTTPEKTHHLNMAAKANKIDVSFVPFSVISETCNSPDEDELSFNGNAVKKASKAILAFEEFYKKTHNDAKFTDHYQSLGIRKNEPVYLATEDSGFRLINLPKELFYEGFFDWTGLEIHKNKLLKKVKEEQEAGNKDFHLVDCFPDTETGPILMDCGGEREFFKRIKEGLDKVARHRSRTKGEASSASSAWTDEIKLRSTSTLLIYKMVPRYSDKSNGKEEGNGHYVKRWTEKPLTLEAENIGTLTLTPRPDISINLTKGHRLPLHLTSWNYTESGFNKATHAELDSKFSYTSQHSERANIIKSERTNIIRSDLAKHIIKNKNPKNKPHGPKRFNLGFMGIADNFQPEKIRDEIGRSNGTKIEIKNISPFSGDDLGKFDELAKEVDAFILPPFSSKPKDDNFFTQVLEQIYTLSSLIVCKQLQVDCFNKPIIVVNENNSWDYALDLFYDLFQKRLIGGRVGFDSYSPTKSDEGTEYYDPRNMLEVAKTQQDAIDFLKHKLHGNKEGAGIYEPYATPPLPDDGQMEISLYKSGHKAGKKSKKNKIELGEECGEKDDKRLNVAIFCSSASQNDLNLSRTKNLSYNLAKNGFGVVCGAGDRCMMGAIADGVIQWRDEFSRKSSKESASQDKDGYLSGSSTPVILYRETESGRIPKGYNHFRLARHIYERIEFFESESDAFVVMEGGAGTLQEFAAIKLLLDHKKSSKPIVICNSAINNNEKNRCWQHLIASLLGKNFEKNYEFTESDLRLLQERNIYIADDENEALKKVSSLLANRISNRMQHAPCAAISA